MHDEREKLPAPAAGERPPIYPLPENTAHEGGHTAADYTLGARTQERISSVNPPGGVDLAGRATRIREL
ncbi:hypothetical protein [Nonomuraea rubra]|uniref:hypothetical protein n=1 Tax=Nonomuraea rubra TaxID=46180 RepID=UPI0031EE8963